MLRSTYHYKNGCMFWVNQCCPVNLFTYRHRDKGSKDPVEQILCMSRSTPKTASHWLRHRTGHLTTSPACSFSQLSRTACTFQLDMYSLFCKSMPEASGACSLTYLISVEMSPGPQGTTEWVKTVTHMGCSDVSNLGSLRLDLVERGKGVIFNDSTEGCLIYYLHTNIYIQ